MQTRREFVGGGAGLALAGCASAPSVRAAQTFALMEMRLGGRLGVCALDTDSGGQIGSRMHEPFAMASTFKWLLAAAVLKLCEGELELGAPVYYTRSDLITYSPVTEAAIDPATGMGALTIEQLCAATVTLSDNTAANLLLIPTFGPEGFTQFIRSAGDPVTRLDRREPDLNENRVNDLRDTTTPQAMAQLAQRLLVSDRTLNAGSRERLISWLIACSTGLDRLRAGFPHGWRAGDKTGTGGNGSHNDVAIVWPPGRGPIVIASYLSESAAANDLKAAAHAEIARAVIEAFN